MSTCATCGQSILSFYSKCYACNTAVAAPRDDACASASAGVNKQDEVIACLQALHRECKRVLALRGELRVDLSRVAVQLRAFGVDVENCTVKDVGDITKDTNRIQRLMLVVQIKNLLAEVEGAENLQSISNLFS